MGQKPQILVDTDILIKTFRGYRPHKTVLDNLKGSVVISVVSYYELMFGLKTRQRIIDLNKQMRAYTLVHINESISIKSLKLLQQYTVSHNLKLPDAFIASTALLGNYQLFTNNKKDFDCIRVISFYNP